MALPLLKGVDEGVQLLSLQLHHTSPCFRAATSGRGAVCLMVCCLRIHGRASVLMAQGKPPAGEAGFAVIPGRLQKSEEAAAGLDNLC